MTLQEALNGNHLEFGLNTVAAALDLVEAEIATAETRIPELEAVIEGAGELHGEARLADTTGTDKGKQAHVRLPEQCHTRLQVNLAVDECRQRRGQPGDARRRGACHMHPPPHASVVTSPSS